MYPECHTNMTLFLLITLLTSYLCFVVGQSPCTTPSNKSGNCMIINNCSSLDKLTKNPTPENIALLKQSFCGFQDGVPQVCCPRHDCTTPDGAPGNCIRLHSCPHLMNLLKPSPTQESIENLKRYRCEGSEQHSVCCGPAPTTTPPPPPPPTGPTVIDGSKCQLTAFPPDPRTECCGIDAGGGGNRIVGGTTTEVDEYPWLALVEYVKNNERSLLCGGVLISGRYVLTAGHCVVGPVLDVGTPENVRLGEHDTSNDGPDCVEAEGGGLDCNDGAVTVPIEKIIAHPEYNASSRLRRHDIALLRLENLVNYTAIDDTSIWNASKCMEALPNGNLPFRSTPNGRIVNGYLYILDFIRPICLPTADFTAAPPPNTILFAAGWGAVNVSGWGSSNIKMKVGLPYVSSQECKRSYDIPRNIQLWENQICAGGVSGQDSCRGDSGGPLMRENGRFTELVGIVSFGPTPCGKENVAGVYSKVFYYLPWIRTQIVA